jgi:hypothetical protein
MDQLSQLTNRPLSSLSIPPSTLSALIRAGYETVQDLDTSNAEKLASGKLCVSRILPNLLYMANRYFYTIVFLTGDIFSEEDTNSSDSSDSAGLRCCILFGASNCNEMHPN